jgi:hypothetical protein
MKPESFEFLKREKILAFEQLKEKIDSFFKEYIKELKEKGAPLKEDGRIEIQIFEKIFGKRLVTAHLNKIDKLKEKFLKEKEGEFMEILIPLVFKEWFERLIVLRTSEYDDYYNKIDHLILDKKTSKVIAAIDTTLNWKQKAKEKKLFEKIKKGTQIFYGVYFTQEGKFYLGSLNEVPVFIVSFSSKDLIEIGDNFLKRKQTEKYKENLLQNLILQSKEFQKICVEKMKIHYSLCQKIFEELKSE